MRWGRCVLTAVSRGVKAAKVAQIFPQGYSPLAPSPFAPDVVGAARHGRSAIGSCSRQRPPIRLSFRVGNRCLTRGELEILARELVRRIEFKRALETAQGRGAIAGVEMQDAEIVMRLGKPRVQM